MLLYASPNDLSYLPYVLFGRADRMSIFEKSRATGRRQHEQSLPAQTGGGYSWMNSTSDDQTTAEFDSVSEDYRINEMLKQNCKEFRDLPPIVKYVDFSVPYISNV